MNVKLKQDLKINSVNIKKKKKKMEFTENLYF